MRELKKNEVEAVNGATILREYFGDLRYIIQNLPGLYDSAINSAADMMCRATENC